MPYRILCNGVNREGVKASLAIASGHFCFVPLHKIRYGIQPSQEDFFDKMHEWSERKLQLLQRYVDPAAKILGSIKQIYYVDGFAGRGTYRDGSKGSPIRIAELAQQYEKEGKSYSFRCINVEEDDEYFANLHP